MRMFAGGIARQAAFDSGAQRLQLAVFLQLIHEGAEELMRIAIQQIDGAAGVGVGAAIAQHGGGRREQ